MYFKLQFLRSHKKLVVFFSGSHSCKTGKNAVNSVSDVIERAKSIEGILSILNIKCPEPMSQLVPLMVVPQFSC